MANATTARHLEASAPTDGEVTRRPFGLGFATAINALVGLAVAAYWFTPNFLRGKSAIFLSPDGDIETYLTGAKLAIHDRWRFPLFETDLIERSVRQSLAFFDLNPLYALVAKIIYKSTGYEVTYVAWWYATAVVMQPIAFTLLLWFMGVRNRVVLLAGGPLALLVPAFLYRVGHAPLFGSFTYIIAMALYFAAIPLGSKTSRWPLWTCIAWPIWLCLVAGVNLYLLLMALVFFSAALIQHLIDNLSLKTVRSTSIYGLSVVAAVAFVLYAIGDFIPYRGGGQLGVYSMNMLSPVVPQFSSLFFPRANPFVDVTGGQGEGYAYLGVGILLLVSIAILYSRKGELTLLRRHWVMALFLVVLTLVAVSNQGYLGRKLVWSVALPESLSAFRATGRFIWPVIYFILAFSLFSIAKMGTRKLFVLVIVALVLQWADMRILSAALYNLGHAMSPAPRVDDEKGLRALIGAHAGVHVEPDFACLNTPAGNKYMVDIAWYSALESRRDNAPYQARSPLDLVCDVEPNETAAAVDKGYIAFTFYNESQIPKDLDRSQCGLHTGVLICMAAKNETFDPRTIERLFSPVPAKP